MPRPHPPEVRQRAVELAPTTREAHRRDRPRPRHLRELPERLGSQGRSRPEGPGRLWVMDVTEHPTAEGKVAQPVSTSAPRQPQMPATIRTGCHAAVLGAGALARPHLMLSK